MFTACKKDYVNMEFTENELYVSVGDQIDLEDYVKDVAVLKDVSIKIENQETIEMNGTTISAKSSGSSYIYAIHKNDILSSINIIVKAKFDAPENFYLAEDGTYSWNEVSGRFKGDSTYTKALRYQITGERYYGELNDIGEALDREEIDEVVETNSFKFTKQGVYLLTIKALGNGKFEDSQESTEQQVSFGTMPVPDRESFTWDQRGIVGWEADEGARYSLVLDQKIISAPQAISSRDISKSLESARAGEHTIGLYVSDPTYQMMPSYVELFNFVKLATPQVEYTFDEADGGKIVITTATNVEKYVVKLKATNGDISEIELDKDGSTIETILDGVAQGQYTLNVVAEPVEGRFYHSSASEAMLIYKLPVSALAANGQSTQNGTKLKLSASATAPVAFRNVVLVNDVEVGEYGYLNGTSNFEVTLSTAGVYNVSTTSRPESRNNIIDGKNVYVLNSDNSQAIEVAKLAKVSAISHAYVSNKSVLSFDKVENANVYKIYALNGEGFFEEVNESLYTQTSDEEKVYFTFADKLENIDLGDEDGVYTFRFEAKDTTRFSIDSYSDDRVLTQLGVTSAVERENTEKTLEWEAVENADKYSFEIYTINKTLYDAGETDIDVAGLPRTKYEVRGTSYTFANVGYYLVRIVALTEEEEEFLPSTTAYSILICVAENLEVGEVTLAKNNEGYMLLLENADNIDFFTISVDGDVVQNNLAVTATETTICLLTTTFTDTTKTYEISVVASSSDETMYLDSNPKVLQIKKLAVAALADIEIQEWETNVDSNLNITAKSQLLTIARSAGAKGVALWKTSDGNSRSGGVSAEVANYHLENDFSIELSFKYYGSTKDEEIIEGQTLTTFVAENEKVFLDSEDVTYTFTRLADLTNYKFYNGDLVFENTSTTITKDYVLTIFCKTANNTTERVVLYLGDGIKALYNNTEYVLSLEENFVTEDGSNVAISMGDLLDAIDSGIVSAIKQVYEQSVKFGFAVYIKPTTTTNRIMSNFATLEVDESKNVVFIEKMPEPTLEYEISGENITLSWDPVSETTGIGAATEYQVYVNGSRYGSVSGSTTATYSLSEFALSTYYSIYVRAENPYYLDSNDSNVLRIYRLDSIKKLKLISGGEYDGQLEYQLASTERNFVSHVLVNGVANETGKIEIDGTSTITLKVVGKTETNGNTTTYYIDSATTTWQLDEMENIKAEIETISYASGVVSWNAFAPENNLPTLEYVLMFKDCEDHVVLFTTTDTSVNMNTNELLFDTIASLAEGDISLKVYAHLTTYEMPANAVGGKIYYADELLLENGQTEYNYHLYNHTYNFRKLTTPVVESVEFEAAQLEDAIQPEIVVSVSGNYGATATFRIYIDGEYLKNVTAANVSDTYEFRLTPSEYNNLFDYNETYEIEIYAVSDEYIPSSVGSLEITRAGEIEHVVFATNSGKVLQKVQFEIGEDDEDRLSGGIVMYIDYTPTGETTSREYVLVPIAPSASLVEYDLTTFVADHLANGGTIEIGAIINSHADDVNDNYILSCASYTMSAEKVVLKTIANANITLASGGFTIDPTINGTDAEYVLEYAGIQYVVSASDDDTFYFEFDNSWANGSYTMKVYAQEDGKMRSAESNITFTLARISSVTEVSLLRDDVDSSQVTLSWNNVVGAEGYIVRLYDANNLLLYQTEVDSNEATIDEIFGESFADVFANRKILSIPQDKEVKISIAVVGNGTTQNDSNEYIFNASIRGNDFVIAGFSVDDYGIINIATQAGERYLYRFVTVLGEEIPGAEWTMLTAESSITKIDASFLSSPACGLLSGDNFALEIKKTGSDDVQSTDNDFVLDSTKFTTAGKSVGFQIINNIVEIGFEEGYPTSLAFVLANNSFDKLYMGISADAIETESVVEILPEFELDKGDNTNLYLYPLSMLLDILKDEFELTTGDTHLYFWANKTIESVDLSYIGSMVYDLQFRYEDDLGFDKVEKYERTIDANTTSVDYANVFVLFDVEAINTIGILTKVTSTTSGTELIFFTNAIGLQNNDYYDSTTTLAVNLTDIFEREELIDAYGTFVVDFARVMLDGNTFVITKWLSEIDGEKTFTRLTPITNLNLSSGVVAWKKSSQETEKFYVYFDEIDSEAFKQLETINNYILASDYVGEKSKFYVGVQAIAENEYIIPSRLEYIKEGTAKRAIYKNEINGKLKLEDGKLFFEWDPDGDFVKKLKNPGGMSTSIAMEIASTTVFTYPFSFTLMDLVGTDTTVKGSVVMKFRFTDLERGTTISKTIDIDAKYLLLNILEDEAIRTNVNSLKSAANVAPYNRIYDNFISWMNGGTYGIANAAALFDDFFERIQSGKYKVEYCLAGGNTTLSSNWYQFDNGHSATPDEAENIFYVNEQPKISAVKVTDPTSYAINDYKLLIKKSKIWEYVAGEYVNNFATDYVLKIYNDVGDSFVFGISQTLGGEFKMNLLDERGNGVSAISVYTTDSMGNVDSTGEYLMFYINHNDSDSILGRFGDIIEKGSYSMQIYAVGNDVSTSSKSEYFTIRFFGLGEDLKMVNGRFTWASQSTGSTTVVYKKNTSVDEEYKEIEGTQGGTTSLVFDLEDRGAGLYDYVEFLTIGRVDGNKIDVDSEIYKIKNVYKLESPIVTNDKGFIAINDSNNKAVLETSYSDTDLFAYKIYNDNSTETSYMTFTDGNYATQLLFHEPGTTGISTTDGEYTYRSTEKNAESFYINSIGSSANFVGVKEVTDPYYVETLYCVDSNGDASLESVAVSSESTQIDAVMLTSPGGLKIENGKLKWNAVTGRDELEVNADATTIYRICVNQYDKTNTATGTTNTQNGDIQEFYTAKTEFDFTNIAETLLNIAVPYYTITIQALALNVASIKPNNVSDEICVDLIEGGVAFRSSMSARYQDTDIYMLISEGSTYDELERTKKIDSLFVKNGNLTWTFTIDDPTINPDNYDLAVHYEFSVYDEERNEIAGTWTYTRSERRYTITFVENAGQISAGTHTMSVYATRIDPNVKTIMSYATTIEITKLHGVGEEYIKITNLAEDTQVEVFSIEDYFKLYRTSPLLNNKVKVNTTINESMVTFLYDKSKSTSVDKMYILSENKTINLPDDVLQILVIGQDDIKNITFQAICDDVNIENVLNSDVSEEMVLQRSNWEQGSEITWDDELQRFEWDYTGDYSLQQTISANFATYDGSSYTIGEETTLTTGTLYRVIEKQSERTIIRVQGENEILYAIDNAYVVGPSFIVEISYGTDEDDRVYTTTDNFFTPTRTHIAITAFSVRVKLGPTNIQSNALEYDGEEEVTLFASGDGTSGANAYEIATEEQFLNISKRMSKSAALASYVSKQQGSVNEDAVFNFKLTNNINIEEVAGICFKGEFQGIVEGNGYTISYTSTSIAALTTSFTIASGYITTQENVKFDNGTALFETLTATAVFRNLNISAHYEKEDDRNLNKNTAFAGLAITNYGQISNVNVVEFESDFIAAATNVVKMIYAGIVSVNRGNSALIKNCNNLADITINTGGESGLSCVAGIVSYNIAKIENCAAGSATITNTFKVEGTRGSVKAYVAGIATINHSQNAVIKDCENYANITVAATNGNAWSVYLAGITDFNNGDLSQGGGNVNHNYTATTAESLGVAALSQGEIYIA